MTLHSSPTRRAFTLPETLVVLACALTVVAVAVPVLGSVGVRSGDAVSLSNLRTISTANDAYAQTFSNRQVTWIPDNTGTVQGSCSAYIATYGCPNPMFLGTAPSGVLWGYFLGTPCPGAGNCGNFDVYKPLAFSGGNKGFGCFRVPNADAFNEFLDGAFYGDVWYSPNDDARSNLTAAFRDAGVDFDVPTGTEIAFSTYCLSPAAMYHPDVFGSAFGGFRSPDTFAEGYASPSVTQCRYPALKTRMIEHDWCHGTPSWRNPGFTGQEPHYFNASAEAAPLSLFFDGHIARVSNAQVIAEDQALFESSGQRLWSRTTPFGPTGYFGNVAVDGSGKTSHTILTIDGILGRDTLGEK
ncbi:MAG: type II secretion system protein [Phycisphaerae bacterium]|nr:type II secretion system protein [Phycisphaerae bacterium]